MFYLSDEAIDWTRRAPTAKDPNPARGPPPDIRICRDHGCPSKLGGRLAVAVSAAFHETEALPRLQFRRLSERLSEPGCCDLEVEVFVPLDVPTAFHGVDVCSDRGRSSSSRTLDRSSSSVTPRNTKVQGATQNWKCRVPGSGSTHRVM